MVNAPRCDFCFSLGPFAGSLMAPDFEWSIAPGHWSRGPWLTCTGCAPFVVARDWSGLWTRVEALDPELADRGSALRLLWLQLDSVAGPFVGGV